MKEYIFLENQLDVYLYDFGRLDITYEILNKQSLDKIVNKDKILAISGKVINFKKIFKLENFYIFFGMFYM
jgi:hypothetical protein